MDRRRFLLTSLGGVLAAPPGAEAQPRARVWKVGYIGIASVPGGRSPLLEAFLKRLRELGYVEGQNLTVEQRHSEGDPARFPALATELLRLDVDVILTLGTPAAQAARRESPSTPIVIVGGRNPVEGGLAKSLARPGGSVTGLIQDVGHDISIKSLELLREAVPRSSRIAVFTSSQTENIDAVRLLEVNGRTIGVTLVTVIVSDQQDIERGFASMSRDRVHAMLALPSHPLIVHRQLVVDLAARYRVPAIYWWADFPNRAGLMSYGIHWADLYRRSADYVAKIFNGAKPGDLPIEQPTKFELVINLKTAKALGLTLPPSLLLRADQVIE